ncbi:MAG: NAD(P)/FAD-dependent oxidoreductase, partial [Candidatus Aenigmatarchaeota archaeon]
MLKCDVLVVGAGPAGSSAAFFLKYLDKENKFNVTLIDSLNENQFVKYHRICGECISNEFFKEINPLKPTNIIEKINCIKEYWPGDIVTQDKIKGFIVNRSSFLRNIIEKFKDTGGKFVIDTVVDISQNKNFVKVKTKKIIKCNYVIAADGANSIIRNKLKIKPGIIQKAVQYIVDEEPANHNVIEIFYDEKYKGNYKWVFPNGNTTKIGFPILNNFIFKINKKVLEKQIRSIGCGRISNYVKGKILLIGDAACQANILTKGGIRPGMVAGKMAAESLIEGNPLNYEKKWKKTKYASPLLKIAYNKFSKMSNKELYDCVKPFSSRFYILNLLKL